MKKILFVITLTFVLHATVLAQGPPPPPPPPGPLPPPGTGAPIDTDVVLLLAVAAAFGGYKLSKRKLLV